MRFISYAQNFEDVMLWRALGDVQNGFYIDVGAADPIDMSVTQAFYERQWRGLNIEPAQHYFRRLSTARPGDVNLNVVLGGKPGKRIFHEIGESGLSTLDARIAEEHHAAGWAVEQRQVECTTLAEICRHYATQDIHFLKIDVEGAEEEVLAGADFVNFRPWIVLLEATRPLTTEVAMDWEPAILAAGYIFVWFDGLNRFYVAHEHHERLQQHFQLPPNSFDSFDKYDFKIQAWRAQQQEERQARQEVERHLYGRLNEVKLLEEERRLRQRRQKQAAAEVSELRVNLDEARHALERNHQRLRDAEYAETQGHQHWEVLNRLAFELRWEDGPRALKLVLPLARAVRKLLVRKRLAISAGKIGPALIPAADLSANTSENIIEKTPHLTARRVLGEQLRRAVHQFHPGSSYGDAVTNSMLLTQKILRGLGYRSEIYVQYRDEMLADQLLLLDDLPEHDDYILIVQHSLGYYQTERLAALPAAKILIYHNITPAHFLRSIPEVARLADIGRAELDFWRPRVAAALTVSHYNALELRQHGYDSVGICPLLLDVDALRERANPGEGRFADDPFTVLFVGRIVENKGQLELVDAFDAFRRRYKRHCQLVLVGRFEGGGEEYLEAVFERIGGHGLRQMVQITGQVSEDELHGWYDRADVYVSLSQHEGFGVPLIEAMAHDLPVIAYAAGGVPFTMSVDGYDAGTLSSRNAEVVADAMLAIATNAGLRSEMICRNRKNLDRFRLVNHIPALVQALLLAGAEPPAVAENRRDLMPHLNFTIAGHFNGTYSLAAVNRSLSLTLAREHPAHVRIQPVETVPTSYLGGVPAAERAELQRLLGPMPGTGPLAVISQHFPVHVPAAATGEPDLVAAYFFWEESLVPAATITLLNNSFHAVFAPSRFVAKALLDSGLRIPVRVVGYVPDLAGFIELGEARRTTDDQDKAFTFLHVSSAFPRKGVDVLLNAFARAFPSSAGSRPVRLIIKTFPNPHNETAAQIARLREVHRDLPEIVLIERDMEQDELLALYQEASAAVLPTRGEGFNMPAAEAIAAGLPLIVTGAGGHIDFVTEQDAYYLPFQLRHSRSHLQAGSSLWFEPDEMALAASLRATFKELTEGDGTGQARAAEARLAVLRRLNHVAWARRVADVTVDILLMSRPRPLRFAWISSWDVRCGVAEYTRIYLSMFRDLVASGDRLAILCDDRTAISEDGLLRVIPAWHGTDPNLNRLAATVNREDPDVLMIQHQPGLISWLSLAALLKDRRLSSRVLVVTLHSTLHLRELPAADREVALDALRSIDRVVVHTVTDINFLKGLGLFDNVVMISQGVPARIDTLSPARHLDHTDVPIIGCYGFLLPPKGLGQLIAALPLLQKNWPRLRLRLVNALHDAPESIAEFHACEALASSLGVTSSIDWFTDFLPHDRSLELLGGCDLIVLPYQRTNESSSAALRSCLASGAAIAVSSIPIFDEAEDAISRLDATTPAGIAMSVSALLSDMRVRQDLMNAGAKWIKSRSWTAIVRQFHGMVTGLVVNQALDRHHDVAAAMPEVSQPEELSQMLQTSESAD